MVNRSSAVAVVLASALLMTASCHSGNKSQANAKPRAVAWRPLGSWSGHGNAQTDSFEIGFTDCRIRWETRNENPSGAGTFTVTVNSAVSGRVLATPVEERGVGHNIAYVSVEPHWSYLVIESSNLDWSVTVEEPAPPGWKASQ